MLLVLRVSSESEHFLGFFVRTFTNNLKRDSNIPGPNRDEPKIDDGVSQESVYASHPSNISRVNYENEVSFVAYLHCSPAIDRRKECLAMKPRVTAPHNVARILLVGGSLSAMHHSFRIAADTSCDDDMSKLSKPGSYQLFIKRLRDWSRSTWSLHHSIVSSTVTYMDAATDRPSSTGALLSRAATTQLQISPKAAKTARMYDYVIIGYGNAGRGAVRTLREECPAASIALIDPMQSPNKDYVHKKLEHFGCRAVGLDPRERIVILDNAEQGCVKYRHAVLVATGARGAPPPHYLMEDKALDRILELRATVPAEVDQRPVLSPGKVSRMVSQAAASRKRVCVLGSGWDAIDLVVTAASCAPTSRAAPTLIFGGSGPLSHVLPSYLSAAISKRLKSKNITVLDRTLIRYISHDDHAKKPCLQIYVAKSFDFLDTNRLASDLLVIAPEMSGSRGNAVLPTMHVPSFLVESRGQRSFYESWSRLTMPDIDSPSSIVCYKEDGRIAVNTEMVACTGVFAAGGVAKLANLLTGHADVAGVGIVDGVASGKIAAVNMSRLYQSTAIRPFSGLPAPIVTKDAIPVWRSDLRSYPAIVTKSSLSDAGVTALCVGNCDSERFFTHGIWWTNQSAHRRMSIRLTEDGMTKRQQRRKLKKTLRPVYGLGFVYYIDRSGRIQGIMSWGVPFTSSGNKINEELVQQMKTILKTNGGLTSRSSEIDQMRMSEFLAIEGRRMAATAFSGHAGDSNEHVHQLDGHVDNFPRPYHRFTEPRPPNVRSVGVMKRKGGQGHGVLGEDLFARYEEAVPDTPPPMPHQTGNVGSAAAQAEIMYEWAVWEQREKQWDDNESRARPPKEDAIWIRKGDEAKNIAARENIAASYTAAIWKPRPYN